MFEEHVKGSENRVRTSIGLRSFQIEGGKTILIEDEEVSEQTIKWHCESDGYACDMEKNKTHHAIVSIIPASR